MMQLRMALFLVRRCCRHSLALGRSAHIWQSCARLPSSSNSRWPLYEGRRFVRGRAGNQHSDEQRHHEKKQSTEDESSESKDDTNKAEKPEITPEMFRRFRIYVLVMTTVTFTGTLYLLTQKLQRNSEQNHDIPAEAFDQTGVPFADFVEKYLKRGEVRKILFSPANNKAVAILHDGAIIDGRKADRQTVTIEYGEQAMKFWNDIRQVETSLGIPLAQGVDIGMYQSTSLFRVFELMLGVVILVFLFSLYGRVLARRIAQQKAKKSD